MEKEEKKSIFKFLKSKVFFINLGLMILITIVLTWLTFILLGFYTNHGEGISVPDFTGLTIEEVAAITDEKSLQFEVIDSVFSEDVDRGTVINQVPVPDQKVKKNRKIYLTINSFLPQSIAVPNFIDLELRAAGALAETYGLEIKAEFVPSQFPTIIKQKYKNHEIKPGTMIEKGSLITLVVGRGSSSEKVLIPRIIGMTVSQAEIELTSLALSIGAQVTDESVITPEDSINAVIYKQSPMPSSENEIHAGGFIDVWLTLDKSKISESNNESENETISEQN
ncbi:MAG: PASTA domain-containing protein [Bacteroidota bacterium]